MRATSYGKVSEDGSLNLTVQRQAVLNAVRNAQKHVDAAYVYEAVRRDVPRISLGTVYRALAALRDTGMIHEIENPGGPALYDGNLDGHQHISCRKCGRVVDLMVEVPSDVLEEAVNKSGFSSVEPHRIDFHGICGECAESG